MKSFAFAAALLASAAVAQPHGHKHHERLAKQHAHEHDKRELIVEIATEWVTATVIIGDDSTQTIPPSALPSNTGGEFFEPSTTTPAPVVAPTTLIPQPTVVQEAPVVASTSVAAAPQEAPASSGGGSNSHTATGDITYYDVGPGACGYDDSADNDTGMIAAISADFWNSISTLTNAGVNMPSNPLCDKPVKLTANGNSVTVIVRDKCPGCKMTSIDVSKAAFKKLFGDLGVGRSEVTWSLSW
ncbi:RlpA-like double-psi beta-barrel-protein domain-containing protein-containing protein [Microdochium trichocladiopsis]|uniref:RlpA-like double-psi beta-barrel-protein domain-containing protein-containing protein n=1 Tax=Microdochium trichocladiopsis TaxID=1682393 RepID=A0A9P8Y392_9PEZI|nr:RlpA-like double-psi beta-barrel-protein domain-containing protein-containing protein [Microdochium trichocladiopsis]KAH7026392.1 RlpA-like double-psi beta-barrel-protein domain-containing protein-containing protein [Microdochium trichocladiopsis]